MLSFLLLVAVGAAVVTFLEYQRACGAARDRVMVSSRVVHTAAGPIEYAALGSGPPVLVIHGAGGGWDQGLDFGRSLAARGHTVIAVSRFGYLRTPLPADASPQAQADAHAALLDALGIARVAVIGGSAGAPSALQLALRHPDRLSALVLAVPAAYAPRPGAAPLPAPRATRWAFDTALRSDFLFWVVLKIAPRLLTRALLATPPALVDAACADEKQRVATILEHILPVSLRREGLLNDGAVVSTLPPYELESIRVPTLAYGAEDDLFGTCDVARYTASRIPGARFVGYPTGGHVCVGREAEVAALVAGFLAEVDAGQGRSAAVPETASKPSPVRAGEPMKTFAAAILAVLFVGSALLADAASEAAASAARPDAAAPEQAR